MLDQPSSTRRGGNRPHRQAPHGPPDRRHAARRPAVPVGHPHAHRAHAADREQHGPRRLPVDAGIALVQFDASVLFLNQDPFERIRLLASGSAHAAARGGTQQPDARLLPAPTTSPSCSSNGRSPTASARSRVSMRCMCSDNLAPSIAHAHRLGADVTLLLGYNIAPGYDDALYASKAREAVERFGVQTVTLADAAGILTSNGCARSCRRSSRRSATRAAGVQHPLPDRASGPCSRSKPRCTAPTAS